LTDWFYGPLLYERPENGWCGSMTFLDLELNHDRAASWIAWKYGATSWATWGMFVGWAAAWYNPETFKNYYTKDKERGPVLRLFNGNAQLAYAGNVLNHRPDPSATLRIKAMRDGEEEYEMLRMLTELSGSRAGADSLTNLVVPGRPLGQKSVGRLNEWNHNPGEWDLARLKLGECIEALVKSRAGSK
jgi:hypothetical protein